MITACVALEGWNIFQLEVDSSGIEEHIEQVVAFGIAAFGIAVVASAFASGYTSDIALEKELVLLLEQVVS